MATFTDDSLARLVNAVAAGAVTPVIDRIVPLDELADAIAYVETKRARGKVVVLVDEHLALRGGSQ